ncbi:hypothetical protein ABK040_006044 [Willaertia magna]
MITDKNREDTSIFQLSNYLSPSDSNYTLLQFIINDLIYLKKVPNQPTNKILSVHPYLGQNKYFLECTLNIPKDETVEYLKKNLKNSNLNDIQCNFIHCMILIINSNEKLSIKNYLDYIHYFQTTFCNSDNNLKLYLAIVEGDGTIQYYQMNEFLL